MITKNLDTMKIIREKMNFLEKEEFQKLSQLENYQILDTRKQSEFMKAHIPKSINITLNPKFTIISKLILDYKKNILVICQEKEEKEIITSLISVGFHEISGFLKNGFCNWDGKIDSVNSICWKTLEKKKLDGIILDIRKSDEHKTGVIEDSKLFPFPVLKKNFRELDQGMNYYLICRTGKSSMASYCFLKNNGFKVFNIQNGFSAKPQDFPLVKPKIVCK